MSCPLVRTTAAAVCVAAALVALAAIPAVAQTQESTTTTTTRAPLRPFDPPLPPDVSIPDYVGDLVLTGFADAVPTPAFTAAADPQTSLEGLVEFALPALIPLLAAFGIAIASTDPSRRRRRSSASPSGGPNRG